MSEYNLCNLCKELQPGDTLYKSFSWEAGIEYHYINDIQYCPLCGAKLMTWRERLKLVKEAQKNETEGNN